MLTEMPASKIRVIQPYQGGSFGNRLYPLIEPMAVLASLRTKRNVLYVLDREEMYTSSPSNWSCVTTIKLGAKKDGTLVAQPFHGDQLVIYKKQNNSYQEIYRYPNKTSFIHALWGGKLLGKPVFLCGCRGDEKEFFMLSHENGKFKLEMIEKGFGPSNLSIIQSKSEATILVANREAHQAALYTVTK